MKVQFELTVGENKFTLIEDVESHTDFFKKMSFYSSLPKVGPNGETDLVIQHRVAQKQYDYYSIVSKKADQEYKFGQPKEAKGVLFPKGWEPIFHGEEGAAGDPATAQGFGAAQATGFQAPQPAAAPAALQQAAAGFQAPKPAAAPAQAPAPAAAPPAAQAPAPQVNNAAAAILNKFGL